MKKRYLMLLALLGIACIPIFAFAAVSSGLVPCGGSQQPLCTLCYLYTLAQNIINFLMWQATPVIAILAFSLAGFKILISGANPGQRNEGFGIIKKTLVGMLIVFSAWIIINEALLLFASPSGTTGIANVFQSPWNQVNCVIQPVGPAVGPAYDGPGAPAVQAQSRKTLAAAGINAKTNYCQDFTSVPCTTLAQLPPKAINGLIAIKNSCNCTPFITGGTETIGHTNHGPGISTVDVAMDAALTNYIYAQVGGVSNCTTQSVKGILYQLCSANGVNYLNEINHWHIHWL